jgi:hypothetical protein
MSAEACRNALLAATLPEKILRGAWKEAILRRTAGLRIGVYRDRPRVSGIVPNMFWLDVTAVQGGASISATETRTLAAGWWMLSAVGIAFLSLGTAGGRTPFGWIVAGVGAIQLFFIFLHFVVSLFQADSDRRWLASFLESKIAAQKMEPPMKSPQ